VNGCGDCESEALARVIAVRDLLDLILWAETDPLRGVERAIQGLGVARGQLLAAGYEGAP
jgi:hypothetical protein